MDRLTIEYAGQYVPKKICTVNRFGEADDCASCEEECENDCENCAIQECFNALGVYENLEVTPEQIREIDKLYAEKCRELEELKKNHGLPCAVGDIVYRVSLNDVKEYKVFAINIGIRENASSCVILTKNNRDAVIGFETIDFGKTVFLSREEAEAKLAEMEGANETN